MLKFLKVAKWLIKEDLGSMKNPLKDFLKFYTQKEQVLGSNIWDFYHLMNSETYKSLSGQPKSVLDTLVKIIEKTLENDKKEEFITKFNS